VALINYTCLDTNEITHAHGVAETSSAWHVCCERVTQFAVVILSRMRKDGRRHCDN